MVCKRVYALISSSLSSNETDVMGGSVPLLHRPFLKQQHFGSSCLTIFKLGLHHSRAEVRVMLSRKWGLGLLGIRLWWQELRLGWRNGFRHEERREVGYNCDVCIAWWENRWQDVTYWVWFKLRWKHSNVTKKNSNKNLLPCNTSEGGGEFECFSVHLSFYKLFP